MVVGCFSLVLLKICRCSCLFVFIMYLDVIVMDGCHAGVGAAHADAFDGPEAELCEAAVVVTKGDTWEWCGVKVPVVRDTWDANVLALAVAMLLKKSSEGLDAGLILCEPEMEIDVLCWMKQFGVCHTFVTFDRTASTEKIVSIGMFLWAVKCGFISEAKLCGGLRRFHGSLLYQAVNLCHGSGLVDEDVAGFVRCVFVLLAVVC